MSDIVCFYHAKCADGMAAAWAVCQAHPDKEVLCRGVVYNVEPDYALVEGKVLYIVDFSFPTQWLKGLEAAAEKLVLLDHHKSALDNLKDFVPEKPQTEIVIDLDRSGAALAWDYFFDPEDRPYHIEAVQDYDLWKHELEHSSDIVEFIYATSTNPDDYALAFEHYSMDEVIKTGQVLGIKKRKSVRDFVSRATNEAIEYDNQTFIVPVVNCPPEFSSMVGHELCNVRNSPFSISYYDSGKRRYYSLRGNGEFDCAKFAETFGGGGHHNAAGFSTRRPYWIFKSRDKGKQK